MEPAAVPAISFGVLYVFLYLLARRSIRDRSRAENDEPEDDPHGEA